MLVGKNNNIIIIYNIVYFGKLGHWASGTRSLLGS